VVRHEWKGNKIKLQKPLIAFLCLLAFCNASPDAFAPPILPRLRVALTPTNTVLVAWSTNLSSFFLQQKTNVAITNWVSVTNIPTVANTEYQVIIAPNITNCFYRLVMY
jgi:hypothetical protein